MGDRIFAGPPRASRLSAHEDQIAMVTSAFRQRKVVLQPVTDAVPQAAANRPGTGASKSAKAMADRRVEILAIATRRFAEFGFEATTVRQIADDANILSGSLYHHFATKDEMLHEIVQDAALQLRDNTIRISKLARDAEHRLVALLLLDLGELTRNHEVHKILSNERKLFRNREEFAYIVQAKKAAYLAWRKVLEDGIKAKLFKPDINIYLTISTALRMLNAAADRYKNEDIYMSGTTSSYTLDQMIDFYLDFIVSAVRLPARAGLPIPREGCEGLATFRY